MLVALLAIFLGAAAALGSTGRRNRRNGVAAARSNGEVREERRATATTTGRNLPARVGFPREFPASLMGGAPRWKSPRGETVEDVGHAALLAPLVRRALEERLAEKLPVFAPLSSGRDPSLWQSQHAYYADAAASVLLDEAERYSVSNPVLSRELARGAASFAVTHAQLASLQGRSPSSEFFERLEARNADYEARVREHVRSTLRDARETAGASLLDPALWERHMALAWEALRSGVSDVFAGSHGGGPALDARLAWTPLQAEHYLHDAWEAAR